MASGGLATHHHSFFGVSARKQLSMVLPVDLLEAIKQRAADQGLSITAYVSALVRADLGQPASTDLPQLAEQVRVLQARVEELERQRCPNH